MISDFWSYSDQKSEIITVRVAGSGGELLLGGRQRLGDGVIADVLAGRRIGEQVVHRGADQRLELALLRDGWHRCGRAAQDALERLDRVGLECGVGVGIV